MFRNWRRQWRRRQALMQLAPRIDELSVELSAEFARPVTLESSGTRGRDSIFIASDGPKALAVLRVINPFLKRKAVPINMPYTVRDAGARLTHEWNCYERCAELGIGPKPLWRTVDAIACEYIEGDRLSARLEAHVEDFWAMNIQVSRLLATLHAHDIVHMDASLANTIAGQRGLCLIDFEYEMAEHITLDQSRCYDHLRLIESGLKFVPDAIVNDCKRWIDSVRKCEPTAVLEASMNHLSPALPRIFAHRHLRTELARCFIGLALTNTASAGQT